MNCKICNAYINRQSREMVCTSYEVCHHCWEAHKLKKDYKDKEDLIKSIEDDFINLIDEISFELLQDGR